MPITSRIRRLYTIRTVIWLCLGTSMMRSCNHLTWVASAQEESVDSDTTTTAMNSNNGHNLASSASHLPCFPGNNSTESKYDIPRQDLRSVVNSPVFCVNNTAGGYPCSKVDLVSFLSLKDLGNADKANDVWGWTSPDTAKEYAIIGTNKGTAFVDMSDAVNPRFLGRLPYKLVSSSWFDMKVYKNHVFVVSEGLGAGMQIYDLTRLDDMEIGTEPDLALECTARYNKFGTAHNIVVNEESGFAYAVGIRMGLVECRGGLHMIDVRNPADPKFAGCYGRDGYTHDAQCVIYHGPDTRFVGQEICLASNEDTVTVIDVTRKWFPRTLGRFRYSGTLRFKLWNVFKLRSMPPAYTHQGWLTEDHRHFLLDDETDNEGSTQTFVVDVSDLRRPTLKTTFCHHSESTDHNQYVKGNHTYQSNYRSGLRILDIHPLFSTDNTEQEEETDLITEVAYFDIYPNDNDFGFNGAWGNYPFFASHNIAVSGMEQGLYVVRPHFTYESSVRVRDLRMNGSISMMAEEEEKQNGGTMLRSSLSDNKKRHNDHRLSVTITVHDHAANPVGGATVTGMFFRDDEYDHKNREEILHTAQRTCVTESVTGECDIVSERHIMFGLDANRVHFDIVDVMMPLHRYESKANEYTSLTISSVGDGDGLKHVKHKDKRFEKERTIKQSLHEISKAIAKGLAN